MAIRIFRCASAAPGLALAAILGLPSAAQGITLYTGTNIDLVASNPVPVGLKLEAFTLSAVGMNGAIPNTFDSSNSGQGGTGITTVGNNLAQVWEFNAVPTPTSNLDNPGDIPQDIDTHFLVNSTQIFSVVAPQENRLVPNPSENPDAGFGNALWGTFALSSQSSSTWNFAYVVVPLNTTVQFDFQLAAPGFPAESINTSWTLTFPPGDVNMDGVVNGLDVGVVSSNWLMNTRYGDANGDGIVNGLDIAMIAANWLLMSTSSAAIPEPPGAALGAIGLVMLASARMWTVFRRRCR
jgi:hypothetical protein